jgi:3-methyladenine DNA glycosylase/8-oxoguanine DNA glycosylase
MGIDETLFRRADRWRPFRAYAPMYLWKRYPIKLSRRQGVKRR